MIWLQLVVLVYENLPLNTSE